MRKPKIKKGMLAFVGCRVGERRLGTVKSLLTPDHDLVKLESSGYLEGFDDGKCRWFSLTIKGKNHIVPMERTM